MNIFVVGKQHEISYLEAHFIVKFGFYLESLYVINTMSFKIIHKRCPEEDGLYGNERSVAF